MTDPGEEPTPNAAERARGNEPGTEPAPEAAPAAGGRGEPPPQPAGPRLGFYVGINLAFWGFLAATWFIMRAMLTRNFSQIARPDEYRAPDRGVVLLCLLLAGAFALASAFDYIQRRMDRSASE